MRLPRLVGLKGFTPDDNNTVTFQFKSADQRSHYVPIHAGVLNAMLPLILRVRQGLDESGTPKAVQPATLTAVRAAYHEDGSPMLGLELDGVMLLIGVDKPRVFDQLLDALTEFKANAGGQSFARH